MAKTWGLKGQDMNIQAVNESEAQICFGVSMMFWDKTGNGWRILSYCRAVNYVEISSGVKVDHQTIRGCYPDPVRSVK